MPAAKSQAIALTIGLKYFWTWIWNVSDDPKLFCKIENIVFFRETAAVCKIKSDFTIFFEPVMAQLPASHTKHTWSLKSWKAASGTNNKGGHWLYPWDPNQRGFFMIVLYKAI